MPDLLIVGAGPAGLAAAIQGAQTNMDVVVFEPRPAPIDKACGEGLMPPALATLETLGVERPPGVPFKGIRYVDGAVEATGHFSNGPGLGVRRVELHQRMWARAEALGVQIVTERVGEWSQDENGVEACGFRAPWMLAADGLQSPMRRTLDLALPPRRPPRIGMRRHFPIAPWSDYVEVHWSPNAEAYVTPVAPDQVGIAILTFSDRIPEGSGEPFDRLLQGFPALRERVGQPCTSIRGAGPFEQRMRTRRAGRILLIGDAAGYLDPLTGEGVRLGFDTASAALTCIQQGRPQDYDRVWSQTTRRYWWMTDGLLRLGRNPWTRRNLVPLLRRSPWIFDRALDALNAA